MELVFNIIKGVMIGIANVIPGVSGGTMAVSFGIYDRLISSISGFTKHVKESLALLAPILLGCALGIAGFTYAIEYLLENHTFVTCMTFVGLILGGLPALYRAMNEKKAAGSGKMGAGAIIAFLLAFAVSAGLPLLKTGGDTLAVLPVNGSTMAILFVLGIVASATMVIPGLLLAPFGIGVLLGIVLIARLISFLFERYGVQTYGAILGLVLASPFAIFYNTGLFGELSSLSVWAVLLGIMLMIGGAVVTNFVGEK